MFVVVMLIRFLQSCVFLSLVVGWFGADPKHPAVQALRAIAEPFLALARPLARKLPGTVEWAATAIVLFVLDIVRRLLGG